MNDISEEDKAFLAKEGFSHLRKTENGGIIGLYEYLFTTGLMGGVAPNFYDAPYKNAIAIHQENEP